MDINTLPSRLADIAELVTAFPGSPFRMNIAVRATPYVSIVMPNGEEVRLFMDDITVRVVSLTSSGVVTSEASFSSSVSAALIAGYVSAYIAEGA